MPTPKSLEGSSFPGSMSLIRRTDFEEASLDHLLTMLGRCQAPRRCTEIFTTKIFWWGVFSTVGLGSQTDRLEGRD